MPITLPEPALAVSSLTLQPPILTAPLDELWGQELHCEQAWMVLVLSHISSWAAAETGSHK